MVQTPRAHDFRALNPAKARRFSPLRSKVHGRVDMATSRAFSLAEALVAFAVVVVASLTLTVTYSFSQARLSQRADQLQAVSYAQQCIEYVREQIRDGLSGATSS